jgi:phosphoglycerate dehydrogenase-like enzyme
MSEVVVGLLYPQWWYGDADAFATEVAAIEALDPRVRVVVEEYEEGQHLRTLRGTPPYEAARAEAPQLTAAQTAAFDDVEVVVAIDLPFDVVDVAPNLKWVQGVGAGSAQLQSAGLADSGIRLTNAAGANATGIAEFAMGRLIAEWKHFRELQARQDDHNWEPVFGSELAGCTLGLIGFGAIASNVARRAKAFDMEVLATRRSWTPGATAGNVDELFPTERLHEMLGRCDAVISAVPETPETTGLMDETAFSAMKPGAWFCNVGRGTLVDEPALIAALESGQLRGAALDVASREPLPPEDPLWDAPNLYMSFHCSTAPGRLFTNLHALFLENLRSYLAGGSLNNEVDLGT